MFYVVYDIKTGHFRDILLYQSLSMVLMTLSQTRQKQTRQQTDKYRITE